MRKCTNKAEENAHNSITKQILPAHGERKFQFPYAMSELGVRENCDLIFTAVYQSCVACKEK